MLELNYGNNPQSMFDPKYFKRKENLVIKDFETAFKCYEKLLGKIANVRQWTVTVMVAYKKKTKVFSFITLVIKNRGFILVFDLDDYLDSHYYAKI